jgi:hypothetical protein
MYLSLALNDSPPNESSSMISEEFNERYFTGSVISGTVFSDEILIGE